MARPRLAALLTSGLLVACISQGPRGRTAMDEDWTAFAASVYAAPAAAREAQYAEAADAHAAERTPESAIRLAILMAGVNASPQDLGAALDLLDEAETGLDAADRESRNFIGLFRPLLLALESQRSRLDAESLAREALAEQLEELKALEEALNATDRSR